MLNLIKKIFGSDNKRELSRIGKLVISINKLEEEISAKSQVAIITHNKKTMKFSNKLIGITSKLEGLSEVIPVDLSE